MGFEGVTIGHSRNVVGNKSGGLARARRPRLAAPFRRQHLRRIEIGIEQIAYRDQFDEEDNIYSGKFRSLLIDVFGRTFPEKEFFQVERDAVVAYKLKVQKNMRELRETLLKLC